MLADYTEAILISNNKLNIDFFKEISRKYEAIEFFYTSEEIGREIFRNIETMPAIVLLRGITNDTIIYTKPIRELEVFLKINTMPLIKGFDETTIPKLFTEMGNKGIILLRENDEEGEKAETLFKELAYRYREYEYIFIVSDIKIGLGVRIAKMLEIEEKNLPHMEIVTKSKELERTKFVGKFNIEEMDYFVSNWMSSYHNKKFDL